MIVHHHYLRVVKQNWHKTLMNKKLIFLRVITLQNCVMESSLKMEKHFVLTNTKHEITSSLDDVGESSQ